MMLVLSKRNLNRILIDYELRCIDMQLELSLIHISIEGLLGMKKMMDAEKQDKRSG